jgi:hypothetical protein
MKLLFLYLLIACWTWQVSALDKIIMWDKNFDHPALKELVTLAADLTVEEYGAYQIERSIEMEQGRAFVSLAQSQSINLATAAISRERENTTLPIYFPLTRGLLGFRLCLVKKQNIALFENINTTRDFRSNRLLLGVGAHWPDKTVIEQNQLQAVSNPVHAQLYDMLNMDRFDCFPRGIAEIAYELEKYPTDDVVVEDNIALIYPNAHFMFISPTHVRLKERLETGLMLAKQNGDYKRYFDKHYLVLLKKHGFYSRKLLFLTNPDLSPKARKAINQFGIASFSY